MSRRCLLCRSLVVATLLLGLADLCRAAGESVEDFLKLKPKWEELVGSKFLLQGRISGTTDTVLGMFGCSLEFRSKEKLPRFEIKKDVVEISGELARDDRTRAVYFKINHVKRIDSDDRVFERRRLDLSRTNPHQWYELGDWAVKRGTFYKDADLIQKGRQCNADGIRIERSSMSGKSPEKLQELARKSAELTGTDILKRQLNHEAAYVRASEALKQPTNSDELLGLAMALAKEFSGSDQPLGAADKSLRDEYLAAPIEFYDRTVADAQLSSEQRDERCRKLHRVLFSELVGESLRRRLAKDGSNGKAVAAELLRLLPEHGELALSYRDAEYAARVGNVGDLSYSEMTALRKELTALGRGDTSKDLHLRWFTRRDEALRKNGAAGLVELATLYHVGYEGPRDRRRLVLDLLFEVERLRPGMEEAKKLFDLYGYRQYEGRWMTDDEIKAIENSPIGVAIREGRVIPGMSPSQVRKVLGTPSAITKLFTSKHVVEYWIYRESRFSVKLTRQTSRPEAVVAAVDELPVQ